MFEKGKKELHTLKFNSGGKKEEEEEGIEGLDKKEAMNMDFDN